MRVLLDECIPRRLKRELPDHTVMTVPEAGWAGVKNGALLKLAVESFDVFVTVDRGMRYQQNLSAHDIAVVMLVVRQNKLEAFQPLIPELLKTLTSIESGQLVYVGSK